jgi:putative acyl-CoA dehydrogenase
MMALALQASLLLRHSTTAVADAFCATRLDGDWGRAFGTMPAGVDEQSIIERMRIEAEPLNAMSMPSRADRSLVASQT